MDIIGEEKEGIDLSVSQDLLSPDVKEFLRKNRIRMKKDGNGKSPVGSGSLSGGSGRSTSKKAVP